MIYFLLILKYIYQIIKKHNITNIISLVTSELNIFSLVKDELENKNVKIYISDRDSIITSSNKYFLYFMIFLSTTNVLGYLVTKRFNAVMLFALICLVTFNFNKNICLHQLSKQ